MPNYWKAFLSVVIFVVTIPVVMKADYNRQKTADISSARSVKVADSLMKAHQIDSAIVLYTTLLKGIPENGIEATRALIGLGQGYLLKNQLDTALLYLHRASTSLKNFPAEKSLHAATYSATGVVHARMKNFDNAISYFDKALVLLDTPDVNRLKALVNLGGIYLDQGNSLPAKETLTEALALAGTLDAPSIAAVIHTNLSNLYITLKDWPLAETHARQSLHIRDSLGIPASAITLNNLGYAQVKLKKTDQGIQNYRIALQSATPVERVQLLSNLQKAHAETGNFKQANHDMAQLLQLKDSLHQINLEEKIATINTVHQTAEKQQQINNLQATNKLRETQLGYLAMAGVFLLIGIGAFVRFRLRHIRMKQALERSQLKQRLLQAQLNPHFIFNAMNRVQQFIYAHDVEKSTSYLRGFAALTRLTLESSDKGFVSLSVEIEMLNHYLQLQQLGSTPPFAYTIDVGTEVDPDGISIPVMLIQPFVENAVVHGVKDRTDGQITLSIKQVAPYLVVGISDNGRGIPAFQNRKPGKHRSFGMDIIDQRIHEYNKANRIPIKKTIDRTGEDPDYPGTCISLSIPIG